MNLVALLAWVIHITADDRLFAEIRLIFMTKSG